MHDQQPWEVTLSLQIARAQVWFIHTGPRHLYNPIQKFMNGSFFCVFLQFLQLKFWGRYLTVTEMSCVYKTDLIEHGSCLSHTPDSGEMSNPVTWF